MVKKFREYESYEGKVFSDPETVIRTYESGKISLRTRIFVLAKTIEKSDFTNEQKKKYLLTTPGKIIFNRIFPNDFPYINFPYKTEGKKEFEKNLEGTLNLSVAGPLRQEPAQSVPSIGSLRQESAGPGFPPSASGAGN